MKSIAILSIAIFTSPLLVQAAEVKEVDFSGLSQFKPGSGPADARKYKTTCTSRYSGKVSSDEKGFDSCLSEIQQGNFQEQPKDRQNPNCPGTSVEFKTELN